jgi:Ser/Thr protein kinase RdoA (MazF antagonist)
LAELLEGREMEHVEIHGDFTPSNLLIDKDRTAGIDFGAKRRLPHYYDICRFLVHLEAQRPAPKWLGAHPERFAAEAFLEGYGERAPAATGDIMNYMMLMEVLRRWAAIEELGGTIPVRLLRSIETRRLRTMAVNLTKALA